MRAQRSFKIPWTEIVFAPTTISVAAHRTPELRLRDYYYCYHFMFTFFILGNSIQHKIHVTHSIRFFWCSLLVHSFIHCYYYCGCYHSVYDDDDVRTELLPYNTFHCKLLRERACLCTFFLTFYDTSSSAIQFFQL